MSVLQVVQPGLAGLMGGSVSTPTPLFAATTSTWVTFLVGLAASSASANAGIPGYAAVTE